MKFMINRITQSLPVIGMLVAAPCMVHAQGDEYKQLKEPFKLMVSEVPLDTATSLKKEQYDAPYPEPMVAASEPDYLNGNFSGDSNGHAAPWLVDLGSGKRDLVVGAFGGGFRVYRNIGSDKEPRFSQDYTFLKAGDKFAQVHIHCCIPSTPRFVDIDGDGVSDLLSSSYSSEDERSEVVDEFLNAARSYWWKGLGKGKFGPRRTIRDDTGLPLYAHPDIVENLGTLDYANLSPTVTPVYWFNAEGPGVLPDLLIASLDGHIYVRRRLGGRRGIPKFSSTTDAEVRVDFRRGKALPEGEEKPSVVAADWDGDGLWDILCGAKSGAVYYFRNSGKSGAPAFGTRELLISPGKALQLVDRPEDAGRGIRSYIQVTDFNGDGKADILLGDYTETITPREGLSAAERGELAALKVKIDSINPYEPLSPAHLLTDLRATDEFMPLRAKMSPYLKRFQLHSKEPSKDLSAHGFVWVYLRK
jgi:hypothetical protein